MVTSYPRGQGCNSHLHYCSGQPIFWSYLFFRSKEEDQMRAARGMPAFVQERVLVSLEGEKASSYGGLKEQRISLFFFCPCWATQRHLREQSVHNVWESIPWSKGSGICGWVQSLWFLRLCCQITHGPFLLCQCFCPVSTKGGQKGKSLDYTVSLSLNLKFWCR